MTTEWAQTSSLWKKTGRLIVDTLAISLRFHKDMYEEDGVMTIFW